MSAAARSGPFTENVSASTISIISIGACVAGVTGIVFCASYQLISEIFVKTFNHLLQNANWTADNHRKSIALLNISIHAAALFGSIAITALVGPVDLPFIDSIVLILSAYVVYSLASRIINEFL